MTFFLLSLLVPLLVLSASTNVTTNGSSACPCPDVFLDVPNVSVDQILLEVDSLAAHVSLDAKVASLVSLNAGVDVSIKKVIVNITGVRVQAQLTVRLGNVVKIAEHALAVLTKHPEILTNLVKALDGLLSTTVNELGQTVKRLVLATGDIVSQVVDSAGNILSSSAVGNILSQGLQVVSTVTNSLGQTVQTVRDTSGALIEVTLNSTGGVLNAKIKQ